MESATIYDAKAHFSALVDRVHEGDALVVTKHGVPWVQIVPIPPEESRQGGDFRGRIRGDVTGSLGEDAGAWG